MNLVAIMPLNLLCDEWKDFDDSYVIGSDGFIYRRLKSNYCRSRKYGYQQVRNSFGTGKQHTVKNSKACALAFVPNPLGLTDIDHINNDKTDNRADNLQWLSHRDNVVKMYKDRRRNNEAV